MDRDPTAKRTQTPERTKTSEELKLEELRNVAIYGTGQPLTGIRAKIVQNTINMGFDVNDALALDAAEEEFETTLRETKQHYKRVMDKYEPSNETPEVIEAFREQHRKWCAGRFTLVGVPDATAIALVDTQILEKKT